ncbi:fungal-specific transcription factor domain-containing protein [Trichophaea hybrida]|nr:fungal-specific transcription factor domain-containing protein [Trichophaea hybrida]
MVVLAVGSQLVKVEDIYPPGSSGNSPTISQERHGWKFFELARKYLDLNKPIYTIEDATVLLLMSIYLDKATLPSPCWMICGAMARVCQDIGLHRQPPNGRFTPIELESRSRLFWAAYIQDKRVSIKMGRPWILRQEDCDIALPATLDDEGIGTSLLCQQVRGIPVGGLGGEAPELENQRMVTRRAIKTFRATIEVCHIVEKILGYKPSPGEGTEHQIRRLQHLDGRLERSWSMLPPELVNPQRNEALDLPSLRVLFITQHARLILFRHFTDVHHITESSREKKMTGVFLKFCLDQSIRVALVTGHLVYQAQLNPDFDEDFGVVTDDLCHLHLFRVAVVLLLGLNLPESNVKQEELNVCVHALQAVARVHITGRRYASRISPALQAICESF